MTAPCRVVIGGLLPQAKLTRYEHAMFVADLAANLYSANVAVAFHYHDADLTDPSLGNSAAGEWLTRAMDQGHDVAIRVDGDVWSPIGMHSNAHVFRAALALVMAAALYRERAGTYMSLQEYDLLASNFALEEVALVAFDVPKQVKPPWSASAEDWSSGIHQTMHHQMPMISSDWKQPLMSVGLAMEHFAIYNLDWYRRHMALAGMKADSHNRTQRVKNAGGLVIGAAGTTYRARLAGEPVAMAHQWGPSPR